MSCVATLKQHQQELKMTLPKLADYRNDLFASHNNMSDALRYVNDVCSAAPDSSSSISMRTIAHIILNTAITMHKEELAAQRGAERSDTLTEQIAKIVRELTAAELMSYRDSFERIAKTEVESAIENKTQELVNECIEEWVGDNLDSKIDDWAKHNIDVEGAVKTYMDDEVDWDDVIGEKMADYFGNNTFSIEPR